MEVSAPGRLCLFGEHQDYLALPVIACPFDARIRIEGRRRDDALFTFDLPDIGKRLTLDPREEIPYGQARDYLPSVINILRREGLHYVRGYDIRVTSDIPMNAGCSSSSAFTVAWVAFLLATQNGALPHDPADIARLGHRAEVLEFNEPGGMMDHYTTCLGGLLYIDTREPIRCEPLPACPSGFVLGHSGEPKNTTGVLRDSRRAVTEGLEALRRALPSFDLHSTPLAEAEAHFDALTPEQQHRVRANLVNRDLCQEGKRLLGDPDFDDRRLGELLTAHHRQLADGLSVSTPKIERMLEAALAAGALGGKINGSGGGGCMFAYAPGREEEVEDALITVGSAARRICLDRGIGLPHCQ